MASEPSCLPRTLPALPSPLARILLLRGESALPGEAKPLTRGGAGSPSSQTPLSSHTFLRNQEGASLWTPTPQAPVLR